MSRQLNLKESFANVKKRRRYSNEDIALSTLSSLPPVCSTTSSLPPVCSTTSSLPTVCSTTSSLPPVCSTTSLSTTGSLSTSLTSTSSFLSQSISSPTEPITPPIFQLQTTISVSSPSIDSELSIVTEHNCAPTVFENLSSNSLITTASSIDIYDPNDIGNFIDISVTKQDATRIYDVLKKPWTPPLFYKFPKVDHKGHSRSVCVSKWLIDFPWLSYSAKLKGVLCRYCVLFQRKSSYLDRGNNQLGQLVVKPLSGSFLKEATTTLKAHEQTQYHYYSTNQANEFITRHINPNLDVDFLLNVTDQHQQNEYKKILFSIVKCILFLASQNLALRGHSDDGLPCDTNLHQGNFKNLIAFRAEAGDIILAKHLQACAKNASYLSPRIQNELIVLSAQVVRTKLIRELIDKRLFYSIMADETSDISGHEQLSISVRYVSSESDENGEFIHEVWIDKQSAIIIFRQLFGSILIVLEYLSIHGDSETSALSGAYHKSISSDIEFITSLIVVSRVFALTKPYTENLQSPTCDLVLCYDKIEELALYLTELLNDDNTDKLYDDLIQFSTQNDIPFVLSRRKKITPRAFFESIYQAFISSTIDELGPRFSTHQKLAIKISKLMPLHVKGVEFADMKDTFEFYKEDLLSDNFFVLESEFEMWRNMWQKHNDHDLPCTIRQVLKSTYAQREFYPNIYRLLTIFATLPVSIATSERSFSTLKLVKTYLRNSMADERLSALAFLHIHKSTTLTTDPQDIIAEFAKRNRRIKLFEE
ncbi:unnamed protein product [Rotaria sp. Silwood2]|nr:unnamed protein product [Rotaria sp. Silwood2]CAF4465924.1 unnamed protein product [Rotaria sp. Silwood2]